MTNPPIQSQIDPATQEDVPQLVELLWELFGSGSEFTPNREAQADGLRLIIDNPNRGRIFVLRSGKRILGMANLLFTISTAHGGHVVLLEDVIILPEYRGQGHGTRLIRHIMEFARSRRFSGITLLAERVSDGTQSFFERFGFARSKMIPMRLSLEEPAGKAKHEPAARAAN